MGCTLGRPTELAALHVFHFLVFSHDRCTQNPQDTIHTLDAARSTHCVLHSVFLFSGVQCMLVLRHQFMCLTSMSIKYVHCIYYTPCVLSTQTNDIRYDCDVQCAYTWVSSKIGTSVFHIIDACKL